MQKLVGILIGAVCLAGVELRAVNVSIYSGFSAAVGGAPYSGLVTNYSVTNITILSVPSAGLASFGADVSGQLQIPQDGSYRFQLVALDPCRMFIDGSPVVGNGTGQHTGFPVTLTAGVHSFEIQYSHSAS